ncbi:MAG TPA: hypothetical protein VJN88_12965, partial [Ktedonobacterales bacterium]|nr:hypothetical protein [Ktedonobacterales bacterium]
LSELESTLSKPYFTARIRAEDATRYVELLTTIAQITPLTRQVSAVATHPEDDLIISTALSGGARYLVTGDQHLQSVQSSGISIVSPSEFLILLADD